MIAQVLSVAMLKGTVTDSQGLNLLLRGAGEVSSNSRTYYYLLEGDTDTSWTRSSMYKAVTILLHHPSTLRRLYTCGTVRI